MLTTVTKRYENLKAAHRQWKHPGHCKFVHGENWSFEIMFSADKVDSCGFVVDFGRLRPLRYALDSWFDHTLLIDEDDPERMRFEQLDADKLCDIRVVKSCSAEGLAELVFLIATQIIENNADMRERGVEVRRVVCFEDNKNSATYCAQ